jgi:small conductance mechanosensitive channel
MAKDIITSSATTEAEDSLGLIDTAINQFNHYLNSPEIILSVISKLVFALLIFWVGKKIAKILSNVIATALEKSKSDPILVNFIKNLAYFFFLIVVILSSLSHLGMNASSLLGMMAAAGLAVGLALKDSLSNFASGVMIVIFKPFKLGDFVEVAGLTGDVTEIRIFNTILTTKDNKHIIIPNGLVTSDPIINYTNQATRRVDMAIGVSYDDDLKLAKEVMLKAVSGHQLVLQEPAPSILLTALGDSSVNFSVKGWAKTEDYWKVYGDVLEQMKTDLEAAGCSIPYPQTDVHVHKQSS